jgi:hypothetical protein
MNDPSDQVRRFAVLAYGRAWPKDRALKFLIDLVDSPNTSLELRYTAVHALGTRGSDAASTLPLHLRLLRDTNTDLELRRAAMDAIAKIGLKTSDAASYVRRALMDEKEDVDLRTGAACAIGLSPEVGQGAIGDLFKIEASNEKNCSLRGAAIGAIAQLKPGKEWVPRLLEIMEDADDGSDCMAFVALGRSGENAKTAIPRMLKALRERKALWTGIRLRFGGYEQHAAVFTSILGPKAAIAELKRIASEDAESLDWVRELQKVIRIIENRK